MPRTPKGTPPAYRQHSSGQAITTVRCVNGQRKDILLGPYGSKESRAAYADVLSTLAAHDGRYPSPTAATTPPAQISINELLLAWWQHEERRRGPDDKELKQYRFSLRPLRELYGHHPAAEFTPKCLRAVRDRMIEADLSRKVINHRISRIKSVFSWGVSEELIPAAVAYGLREVKGLRAGDRRVRESKPREPAFLEDVEKVLPFCSKPIAAMLQLQWWTGMRSGEVRIIRTMDIDRTDPKVWLYRPGSDLPHGRHKNSWRGQSRVVALGPQCQEILRPFLREDDPAAYVFSPRQVIEERYTRARENRVTPMTPSQRARQKKKNPKRTPGTCYTDSGYSRAVKKACERAGVAFHAYGLRHGRKMDIERTRGSEAARCVLGQKTIESTAHYGKVDAEHAARVMGELG